MVLDQTDARGQGADRWHTDNTFMAEPPMGSVLRAVQVPDVGGDTCFASMYAAYDSLSDRMKAFLEGLTALHDITPLIESAVRQGLSDAVVSEVQAAWPVTEHPIVRTHPETGRKALYVVPDATVAIPALPEREGRAILDLLLDVARTPEWQCRFRWERDSIAFWDNRAAQHYAVADYRERRIMRRVTIAGDRPR
jgi:taurine dioxygenase